MSWQRRTALLPPARPPCAGVAARLALLGLANGALRVVRKEAVTRLPTLRYVLMLVVTAAYVPGLAVQALRHASTESASLRTQGLLVIVGLGLFEHLAYTFLYLASGPLQGWMAVAFLELTLPITVLLGGCLQRKFSVVHYVGSVAVVLGGAIGIREATLTPMESCATFLFFLSLVLSAVLSLMKAAHLQAYDYNSGLFNLLVGCSRLGWGVLTLPVGISLQLYLTSGGDATYTPADRDPSTAIVSLFSCIGIGHGETHPSDQCGPGALALLGGLIVSDVLTCMSYQLSMQPAGSRWVPCVMTVGCLAACLCYITQMTVVDLLSAGLIFGGVAVARARNEKDIAELEMDEPAASPRLSRH